MSLGPVSSMGVLQARTLGPQIRRDEAETLYR
jgi:hypothetical protein